MYTPGTVDPVANYKRLKWLVKKPLGRLKDRIRNFKSA